MEKNTTNTEAMVAELLTDIRSIKGLFYNSSQLKHVESLLNLPGLYLVVMGSYYDFLNSLDQIVYIGMSGAIKSRWRNHHKMATFQKLNKSLLQSFSKAHTYDHKDNVDDLIRIYCWYNPFATKKQLKEIERELVLAIKPIFNEKTPPRTAKTLSTVLEEETVLEVETDDPDDDYDDDDTVVEHQLEDNDTVVEHQLEDNDTVVEHQLEDLSELS